MTHLAAIPRTLRFRGLLAASLAGAAIATLPAATRADEVTFVMRNGHPNALRLELYSDDRDHVWPGHDEQYYLDDDETKEVTLSCNHGESICFGAWIDGDESTSWGVGPGNRRKCSDCCYICDGGETEEIKLVP